MLIPLPHAMSINNVIDNHYHLDKHIKINFSIYKIHKHLHETTQYQGIFMTHRVLLTSLAKALLIALSSYSSLTNAEENSHKKGPSIADIEVIRIKGDQSSHSHIETGTVVLIDRAQIEAFLPLSTEDVLRRIAGINIKSEEESSIVANFGLRGLSASESKSLLLEDGVPVAPGLFIGNDRYFNPRIQRVEQIEVLKGSASLRYGPSTIGGVVNYRTKTPTDGVNLTARAGSFNMQDLVLEAGATNNSEDAYVGAVVTHASSDGFMDKGYDMQDVMVKAGTAIGDDQRVGVKLSHHANDANISYRGLLLADYNNGATYNPAPDDYFLQDRVAFDVNHEWDISSDITLNTLAYWSDVTRDYWRYNVDTAASNAAGRWVYTDALTGNNRAFERVGVETRLAVRHSGWGMAIDSEVGVRFMREKSDDTRIRAVRASDRTGVNDRHINDIATSYAGYVQSQIHVTDDFAVTPGVRVESYEQERIVLSSNNERATTQNTEWLPGVGATYEMSANAQLYGGVYRAFSPASNGVALDGLADQNLEGERSTNYEMGIRGSQGNLRYEVAAFYMDFTNQVVTGNSDPNLSQSNAGETEHSGMEFMLAVDIGNGFSVDTNATWVPTSEFKSGEFAGNRLPYAPELLANAALNFQQDAFLATFTAHYRGEQYGDPSNREDLPTNAAGGIWGGLLPAYTVFDLMTQYRFNPDVALFAAVKNIADKRYITGLRQGIYVGPERSFEVGIRYKY